MTAEILRPLGGHALLLLLLQLAVLLLIARIGAELARRVGLPAVVGELAAGVALGPSVFGYLAPDIFTVLFPREELQFHLLEVVGTLGMVLLLLLTGFETDLRLLKNLGRAALIASMMGMVVPFVTGFGLGLFMPDAYLANPDRRILFSFFIATAMAISAMPVIAKILIDLDLTKRNIGLVILSAGVVDDTAGWLILSVIAGAAAHGAVALDTVFRTIALTGAFLGAALVIVYPVTRWITAIVTRRARSKDSDLVLLLVVTLGCAATTEIIGIHPVFGAFVAGTMFRQIPQLRADTIRRLESFVSSVLAPIFFGTVGLKVNLWALSDGKMLALVLAVACFGKLVGCSLGSFWGGLRFWEGLSIAVAMNARGAMELVVATVGLSLGILNLEMYSIIVVVAVVTSFLAPIGLRLMIRKVRMTDDENRRILAEQAKGVFDPERVRVLLPTSGGPNDASAARLAYAFAKRSVHPVEVIYVKDQRPLRTRLRALFPWVSRAADELKIAQQLEDAGLSPTWRELTHRDVGQAILEEASKGFDLIVIGASRGNSLGGSVIEKIVPAAPCHVAIAKAGTLVDFDAYRRLLVPFDGSIFSRVAIEFAVRHAEVADAELTIAVLAERRPQVARYAAEDELSGVEVQVPPEEALDKISQIFRATQVRPEILRLEYDPSSRALGNEAASGKYDLVVIGAENRAVQHRLFFGYDNERLISETTVPVVIVVPNIRLLR